MTTPPHDTVADYDATCSETGRAALAAIRAMWAHLLPDGIPRQERLSYGVPTLFADGRRILHYAAWAEHLGTYPIPPSPADDPDLEVDLAPFVTGKGTLRFPYAAGLPTALLTRVVRAHLLRAEITPTPT